MLAVKDMPKYNNKWQHDRYDPYGGGGGGGRNDRYDDDDHGGNDGGDECTVYVGNLAWETAWQVVLA